MADESPNIIGEDALKHYQEARELKRIAQDNIISIIDKNEDMELRLKALLRALSYFKATDALLTTAFVESKGFSYKINHNLAHINRQLGFFDKAEEHMERVLNFTHTLPDDRPHITPKASTYSFLSMMTFKRKDFDISIELINKALSFDESFEEKQDHYFFKMLYFGYKGKIKEARRIFENDLKSFDLLYQETINSEVDLLRKQRSRESEEELLKASRKFYSNWCLIRMYKSEFDKFYTSHDWFRNPSTEYFYKEYFLPH